MAWPLRRLPALLVALLVACASPPSRPPAGPVDELAASRAVRQDGLSADFATPEQRLAVQQQAWDIVRQRYVDPQFNGIDWTVARQRHAPAVAAADSDAALYAALKRMVRELNDSHTRVLTPLESLDRRRYASVQTGAVLGVIEGRLAIVDVDAASAAARAGLRRGDVITAIDGVAFDDTFFWAARNLPAAPADTDSVEAEPALADEAERHHQLRAVRRVLQRPPDAPPPTYHLQVLRAGKRLELVLASEPLVRPPEVQVTWLKSKVAVLKLNRFANGNRSEVARALRTVADAPALVIDLRGNPGGDYSQYLWLVQQFLDGERTVLEVVTRSGDGQRRRPVEVAPAEQPYLRPIAILTDRRTASAAELLAVTLFEQRHARLVGESTCGCVVGVRAEYVLAGGGGLRVAETGFLSAAGRSMEGRPLAPTHYVAPTLADLQAGRDRALAVAERALVGAAVP